MDTPEFILPIAETFNYLTVKYGLLGIALSMTAENVGVPFASSVVVLTAGQLIMTGELSWALVILLSTAGIVLGSIISYLIGYFGKNIIKRKMNKFNEFFSRYGKYSIFMAQLYGTSRTFISLPAGLARMKFLQFTISTALGGLVFSAGLVLFSLIVYQTVDFL